MEKKQCRLCITLNLASAKAIEKFRQLGCNNNGGKIGIVLNLTPAYPRSNSEEDLKASKIANAVFNESFLDPAVKGTFPQVLVDILREDGMLWEAT